MTEIVIQPATKYSTLEIYQAGCLSKCRKVIMIDDKSDSESKDLVYVVWVNGFCGIKFPLWCLENQSLFTM